MFELERECGGYSLLQAQLKTGRTHQIRVHLAHLGFPIAGDDKYGDFELNKRLAKQGLGLALTPAAKEFLGNQGYDPVYGARPLKRAIQHQLLDPLSLDVLDGRFTDGDVITGDIEQGALVFKK